MHLAIAIFALKMRCPVPYFPLFRVRLPGYQYRFPEENMISQKCKMEKTDQNPGWNAHIPRDLDIKKNGGDYSFSFPYQ